MGCENFVGMRACPGCQLEYQLEYGEEEEEEDEIDFETFLLEVCLIYPFRSLRKDRTKLTAFVGGGEERAGIQNDAEDGGVSAILRAQKAHSASNRCLGDVAERE